MYWAAMSGRWAVMRRQALWMRLWMAWRVQPKSSAVRAMLRILEDKGHLRHEQEGPRYVFLPTVPREEARETALRRLVRTFFGGSPEGAMAALLDLEGDRLDDEALARLSEMIEEAKREDR
jgi:predicted transcriptional regulator